MTEKTPVPTELEWEDPEPKQHKGSKWDPVARMLKAHPGKWACLGRGMPTSVVTDINKGTLKCWRPVGAFEATTRNHSERWIADVYARYVGDDGAKAD